MRYLKVLIIILAVTSDCHAQEHFANVLVSKVKESLREEKVPMQGVIYFDKVSGISTEVDGLVTKINFSKGDRVKKGEVLVELNTDFIEKDIELKQKEIQAINVKIEHLYKDLVRYKNLFQKEAASETDYEDLSYEHKELVKKKEALVVSLEKIRLKKAKSIIYSPFEGMILEKDVDLGTWINSGKILCKIGSVNDFFANIPINETLLVFFNKGTKLDLQINAYNQVIQGVVEGILPIADEKTKNVFLRIRLPGEDLKLAENMTITGYIPTSDEKRVRLVPRDALVKNQGRDFVFTINENKAKLVPVNILSFEGNYANSVSPEIYKGMTVIVDGNQRLRENSLVSIIGEKL